MQHLQNTPIDIKIKLSALWASVTLCYIYCDYFELYVPGKTEGLVNGINMLDSPFKLFTAGVILAIPTCMIFLSIIATSSLSRWMNIVFGSTFTIMMILVGLDNLTPWRAFYVFYAIIEVIMTILIVYYAFKWPKNSV